MALASVEAIHPDLLQRPDIVCHVAGVLYNLAPLPKRRYVRCTPRKHERSINRDVAHGDQDGNPRPTHATNPAHIQAVGPKRCTFVMINRAARALSEQRSETG